MFNLKTLSIFFILTSSMMRIAADTEVLVQPLEEESQTTSPSPEPIPPGPTRSPTTTIVPKKNIDLYPPSNSSLPNYYQSGPQPRNPLPKTPLPKNSLPPNSNPRNPLPRTALQRKPLERNAIPRGGLKRTPIEKKPLPRAPIPKRQLPRTRIIDQERMNYRSRVDQNVIKTSEEPQS